jgi:hypothetical protein
MPQHSVARRKARLVSRVRLFAILMLGVSSAAGAQAPKYGDPSLVKGHEPRRGSFSLLPWEKVDMASGNLVLTFTDLVLPGHNGNDVKIGRVLNMGTDGTGWTIGPIAPLALAPPNGTVMPNPVIQSWDGGSEYTYATSTSGVYMTLEYARLNWPDRTLEYPDGTRYQFGSDLLLSTRTDSYGNTTTYNRGTNGRLDSIVQSLELDPATHAPIRTRTVHLEYESGRLASVYWTDAMGHRTEWGYRWEADGLIHEVTPPAGGHWYFAYPGSPNAPATGALAMLSVTTPEGGLVEYTSRWRVWPPPPWPNPQEHRLKLETRRTVGANDVPEGTWTFLFTDPYPSGQQCGKVVRPDTSTVKYLHNHLTERTELLLTAAVVYAANAGAATTPCGNEAFTVMEQKTYSWFDSVPSPWPWTLLSAMPFGNC